MRSGTYHPSDDIRIPSGLSGKPITIANFDREAATIVGGLVFEGSHVLFEGLTIINTDGSYTIVVDSRTSTPRQDIKLQHLDVIGGTIEAIRVKGNVRDFTLADSLLDGGRDHHVMKILCDDNASAGSCSFLPEDIVITNNHFSKVRSPFFPRPDQSGSEDLLQTELIGNIIITHNHFGQNDYEECVDVKKQGRPGTSIVFSHNIVDSRHNGRFPSNSTGCRGGILFHQDEIAGSTVIQGNWFPGKGAFGGNLIRATHAGTQVIDNLFDQLTISADHLILSCNTFMQGSQLKLGDSTGNPTDLRITNNIFVRTRFVMRGSYTATNNVLFHTLGSFDCPDCFFWQSNARGLQSLPRAPSPLPCHFPA